MMYINATSTHTARARGGFRSEPTYTVSYILNKLSKFLQNAVGIRVGR